MNLDPIRCLDAIPESLEVLRVASTESVLIRWKAGLTLDRAKAQFLAAADQLIAGLCEKNPDRSAVLGELTEQVYREAFEMADQVVEHFGDWRPEPDPSD